MVYVVQVEGLKRSGKSTLINRLLVEGINRGVKLRAVKMPDYNGIHGSDI
jgi:molybdopterin-guanine dinucleotide biosynthesis protein